LKKEISCLETRLDSAEFCISSCLSRMAKMEVWMRKVQDKMDGVVPEVIDLTSEDGEGEDTGDKDPNTHQAHAGYIGSTDNK